MTGFAAAFGSSHSVMLTCTLQDWQTGFLQHDPGGAYFDRYGDPCTYQDLLARAPSNAAELSSAAAIAARYDEVHAAMARLKSSITAARLDALIICGDDQHELFDERQMPSIGIYYGATIRNAARKPVAADAWYARAQMQRLEDSCARDYPCDSELAMRLIDGLMQRNFDLTALSGLRDTEHEGHAFSFVHRKYLADAPLPIVPVFLNTFYPPNQPSPARCLALGHALREIVAAIPGNRRIGIMASGGLSHFQAEADLDHQVIESIRARNLAALATLDARRLQSGSSEIRNWIVLAGATAGMEIDWVSYTPGYRTPALTGTGLCFASWR